MNSRHLPPAVRAAAVADYKASGDSYAVVAARHGMSRSGLHALVNPSKTKRRKKAVEDADVALTGGAWVRDGLVMRWEQWEDAA